MKARIQTVRRLAKPLVIAAAMIGMVGITVPRVLEGQAKPAAAAQKIDEDYTKRIVEQTPDKRILTELVDHMVLDPKVPSPLKFFGYIPGENGKLTYHKDIVRYLQALEQASPRVKVWTIGKTEEGRDMVACAVADEVTIKNLQKYKDITAQLTDPRKTSDAVAKQLIATGKPIYYASGSIHTPEPGSPEMLMELAYRLTVEDTPFINEIRNNLIFVFTPASEVDGREKLVDGQRASEAGQPNPGLAYWGHYVQHDNNRDGIGVGLALTNNMLKSFLDLHPTVFHDLHESEPLLYVSTGTGPYNPIVAPIQVTEWWWLAQNEIMEMTKRGVPGVWTYNYYDGWIPNYMFWIGVTHNSIGRFYETQSYGQAGGRGGGGGGGRAGAPAAEPAAGAAGAAGGAAAGGGAAGGRAGGGRGAGRGAGSAGAAAAPTTTVTPDAQAAAQAGRGGGRGVPGQEKEWYRVDPIPPEGIVWSSRSNVNMQESALLITLNTVAKNREKFLENYYAKNKQMIEQGKTRAPFAYVVPAKQRRAVEAADLMNLLRREGAEVSTATQAYQVGNVLVTPGDYVVRMDQPYGGVVETLMGVQWYPPDNPRPYDDTGWDIPALRNIKSYRIDDNAILDKPMTVATADFKIAGTITGTGSTIVIDHTADNPLITFLFQNKDAKIQIADQAFDLGGHHFLPGAFIIANANRTALEPQVKEYGLMAWATDAAPSVTKHDLSLPRIGYLHSWTSTQDEGWWRMALDKLKVPYTYFGDNLARQGNLRAKYDVILYPQTNVNTATEGMPSGTPVAYKKTDVTPNIGTAPDQTDDTRGGLGRDGLRELAKFVNEGGVLITEGTPARLFPENSITSGITVEQPAGLYVQGSVLKAMLADKTSPVLYGYDQNALGVLFNVGPLFGPGPAVQPAADSQQGGRGGAPVRPGGGSLAPMSVAARLTTLDGGAWTPPPNALGMPRGGGPAGLGGAGGGGPGSGFGGRGRGGAAPNGPAPSGRDFGVTTTGYPRVLLSFPNDPNDILLSGELTGGEYIAGHPVVIDESVGKGHAVLFGCRPFWRFETQGNFFLVFNAMLNWDHLDVGTK
jgi:Zinc carboxypeptidase